MNYTVSVGKGARGRYNKVLTLTGPAAEGFARLTAAMVRDKPYAGSYVASGYRAKVEPVE